MNEEVLDRERKDGGTKWAFVCFIWFGFTFLDFLSGGSIPVKGRYRETGR